MICTECGERQESADVFCVMSDDGEGPHRWTAPEPRPTPEQAATFRRIFEHQEQGGMER